MTEPTINTDYLRKCAAAAEVMQARLNQLWHEYAVTDMTAEEYSFQREMAFGAYRAVCLSGAHVPTRAGFLVAYEQLLRVRCDWAKFHTKLDSYMKNVTNTIDGRNTWHCDGEVLGEAWKAIGGKGKPTLKALRELK